VSNFPDIAAAVLFPFLSLLLLAGRGLLASQFEAIELNALDF
jgi:hypothetical protein